MKQPNYFKAAFWVCVGILLVVLAKELAEPHYFIHTLYTR